MVDFDNLDELKALRARGAVDDRQYELLRRRLARRIISDRREAAFSKSGAVYIVLAFLSGLSGCIIFMPDIISAAGRRRY